MSDDLSSDAVPEPRAERDLEGQRLLDRLRSKMFGVETGLTRIGRWQILQKLGRGAMGTVYSAHDPELDRRVAIKVLHGIDPDAAQARIIRLRREAQAMARVQHPNVVQVYDVCVDAAQPYVVMELIDGQTLRVWQERPGHHWRELVRAYLGAARGLAALHAAGVIHRDFKPDNALLDTEARVRVVDFGLVSAAPSMNGAESPRPDALTREGALIGTLAYMSPEQLSGRHGDAPSDQFSLCRSLFEGVYHVRPFVGQDPEALLAEIREGVSRPPNPLGAPHKLFACLRRGLAYRPEHRFASMQALADTLEQCLSRRPGRAALVFGGLMAVGLTAGLRLTEHTVCDLGEQELVGAWDERQQAVIQNAFVGQGLPDAPEQWLKLNMTMRNFRANWRSLRKATCLEAEQTRPPMWVAQRDRCLDELRSFVQTLAKIYQSPTPADIAGAREAAASVEQRLADCAHIDAQHIAPPTTAVDPRLATAIEQTEAEQVAGRLGQAEETGRRALEIAEQSGVLAAIAAARANLGRVLGHQLRADQSLIMLDDAARTAARTSQDAVRIDALLFAAKIRIFDFGALERAAHNANDAEDFIIRLDRSGIDTTRQTAELHEVHGFLAEKNEDFAGALEHFGQALRLHRQRNGSETPPLRLCTESAYEIELSEPTSLDELRNLHNLTRVLDDLGGPSDVACVEALYRALIAASEEKLGRSAPLPLDLRFNFATHLRNAEHDAEAAAVLAPSLVPTSQLYGDRSNPVAETQLLLGTIALDAEDMQAAQHWSREAAQRFAEHCVPGEGCPPNYGAAVILQGAVASRQGNPAQAARFFRAAIDILTPLAEGKEQLADSMLALAGALADLGELPEARVWLMQATDNFQRQGREADPDLLALQERLQQ